MSSQQGSLKTLHWLLVGFQLSTETIVQDNANSSMSWCFFKVLYTAPKCLLLSRRVSARVQKIDVPQANAMTACQACVTLSDRSTTKRIGAPKVEGRNLTGVISSPISANLLKMGRARILSIHQAQSEAKRSSSGTKMSKLRFSGPEVSWKSQINQGPVMTWSARESGIFHSLKSAKMIEDFLKMSAKQLACFVT